MPSRRSAETPPLLANVRRGGLLGGCLGVAVGLIALLLLGRQHQDVLGPAMVTAAFGGVVVGALIGAVLYNDDQT